VQEDGKPFADELLRRALESEDGLWRQQAIDAIGAAEDPDAAAMASAFTLDERARTNEIFSIAYSQFESPLTRNDAWTWYQQSTNKLFERLPAYARAYTFGVAAHFCDPGQRASAERFLTPRMRELREGELELARALESIDLCVALKKAHSRDIAAALAAPSP
jgi:alanyl aminopeptidase